MLFHFRAMVGHGMRAHGHSRAAKIGDQPFFQRSSARAANRERRRLVRSASSSVDSQNYRFARKLLPIFEQRAGAARGALDLPEGVAAMRARVPAGHEIQSADFGQRRQFGFLYLGHAQLQIFNRSKLRDAALAHDFQRDLLRASLSRSACPAAGRILPEIFSSVQSQSEHVDIDGPALSSRGAAHLSPAWPD